MNRVRIYLLAAIVLLVGLIAFGLGSRPKVEKADSSSFSAERVIEDIRVVSGELHSVAHPEERAEVRNYLISRLEQLSADTIILLEYKDLTGPEKKHVEYTFDATNILATFAPEQESDVCTSLLLVAHYDSRFSQPFAKGDTVWSYGAADDGYGIGVILETVNQALKYRKEWKQGVKVLFTDAEEAGMLGMKTMWEHNREQFEDVGLMINFEARGPYGPALLFETSPGNEKVMDLYKAAEYPFTYSLTTVVYRFMPNYTDFTIVKDEIPGLNFSTIADINHYHTHLDNFSNIDANSIQHYGAQAIPVVRKYLTEEMYSDRDFLKSETDTINFTLPVFGLFNFSVMEYVLLNVVAFILFVLAVAIDVLRKRTKIAEIALGAAKTLALALSALVTGEIVAYLCCVVAGAQFKPFGVVMGVMFDNTAMMLAVVAMMLLVVYVYLRKRNRVISASAGSFRADAASNAVLSNATNILYGTLLLMMLLCIVMLVSIKENLMFFIPLFSSALAIVLYKLTKLKIWILLAIALILLHAFSFLYALAMALTIGAFGAVLMLALLDAMVLVPLSDIYLTDKE